MRAARGKRVRPRNGVGAIWLLAELGQKGLRSILIRLGIPRRSVLRAQGTCQCGCGMGRQDCSAFRPCAEPARHLCGNQCHVPMGCTPVLVGQSPQYGSQTYRSERMGGRPGPRSQNREQMTAPLLFVVGPKVATYRVQMRSPLLFEVGAEGGHI